MDRPEEAGSAGGMIGALSSANVRGPGDRLAEESAGGESESVVPLAPSTDSAMASSHEEQSSCEGPGAAGASAGLPWQGLAPASRGSAAAWATEPGPIDPPASHTTSQSGPRARSSSTAPI